MADGEARVCHQCFEDDFLKREIRRKGSRDECSYCGKTLVTLSLEEIADLFESAIETQGAHSKTDHGGDEHGRGRSRTCASALRNQCVGPPHQESGHHERGLHSQPHELG
jgi:hypothetical protein